MDSSWGRPPARIVQCSRGAKVTRSRRFQNPEVLGSRGPSVCWFAGVFVPLSAFEPIQIISRSRHIFVSSSNPISDPQSAFPIFFLSWSYLPSTYPLEGQAPDFRFSLAARALPRHLRVRLADRVRGESHLLPPETDIVNLPCLFYPS